MENLKKLADELVAIYEEVDQYRIFWAENLKPLLIKTFKKVKKSLELNLKIRTNEDIKNLESIRLTFGYLNSGLLIEPKKSMQGVPAMVLVKKGGDLVYSQMANGKISAYIHFPYIEGIFGDPGRILEIGVFLPVDINQELIMEHIEIFLEQIVKWEKEEKTLIGFHFNRGKK